jgi:putative ABC transport system substrate-binding protein
MPDVCVHNHWSMKSFHGVSTGNVHEYSLKSRIGKVSIIVLLVAGALLAAGSVAAAPQTPPVRRIGYLTLKAMTSSLAFSEIFRQGLRELGYVEGENIVIEYRAAESRAQLAELATELVRLPVEVIVVPGLAVAPAKRATGTVPIVFSYSGDPVEAGFVTSFAHPGGNMTGITWMAFELIGKRLEFLQQAVPTISRVAVLANPAHPGEQRELRETGHTARRLGMTLQYHQVRATADFDVAFEAILKDHAQALVVFPEGITLAHRQRIAEFAVQHRLPSVFAWKEYVEAGGLMAYGPNRLETLRRLAVYVDKILKGVKPSDLPVELPMKFELVLNLKTAEALGLTIPPDAPLPGGRGAQIGRRRRAAWRMAGRAVSKRPDTVGELQSMVFQ